MPFCSPRLPACGPPVRTSLANPTNPFAIVLDTSVPPFAEEVSLRAAPLVLPGSLATFCPVFDPALTVAAVYLADRVWFMGKRYFLVVWFFVYAAYCWNDGCFHAKAEQELGLRAGLAPPFTATENIRSYFGQAGAVPTGDGTYTQACQSASCLEATPLNEKDSHKHDRQFCGSNGILVLRYMLSMGESLAKLLPHLWAEQGPCVRPGMARDWSAVAGLIPAVAEVESPRVKARTFSSPWTRQRREENGERQGATEGRKPRQRRQERSQESRGPEECAESSATSADCRQGVCRSSGSGQYYFDDIDGNRLSGRLSGQATTVAYECPQECERPANTSEGSLGVRRKGEQQGRGCSPAQEGLRAGACEKGAARTTAAASRLPPGVVDLLARSFDNDEDTVRGTQLDAGNPLQTRGPAPADNASCQCRGQAAERATDQGRLRGRHSLPGYGRGGHRPDCGDGCAQGKATGSPPARGCYVDYPDTAGIGQRGKAGRGLRRASDAQESTGQAAEGRDSFRQGARERRCRQGRQGWRFGRQLVFSVGLGQHCAKLAQGACSQWDRFCASTGRIPGWDGELRHSVWRQNDFVDKWFGPFLASQLAFEVRLSEIGHLVVHSFTGYADPRLDEIACDAPSVPSGSGGSCNDGWNNPVDQPDRCALDGLFSNDSSIRPTSCDLTVQTSDVQARNSIPKSPTPFLGRLALGIGVDPKSCLRRTSRRIRKIAKSVHFADQQARCVRAKFASAFDQLVPPSWPACLAGLDVRADADRPSTVPGMPGSSIDTRQQSEHVMREGLHRHVLELVGVPPPDCPSHVALLTSMPYALVHTSVLGKSRRTKYDFQATNPSVPPDIAHIPVPTPLGRRNLGPLPTPGCPCRSCCQSQRWAGVTLSYQTCLKPRSAGTSSPAFIPTSAKSLTCCLTHTQLGIAYSPGIGVSRSTDFSFSLMDPIARPAALPLGPWWGLQASVTVLFVSV